MRKSPSFVRSRWSSASQWSRCCGKGLRRGAEVGAKGDGGRDIGVVRGGGGEVGGEIGELGEEIGGEGLGERREDGADGMVERKFEAGQGVRVEPGLVELRPGEADQVAPLVAQAGACWRAVLSHSARLPSRCSRRSRRAVSNAASPVPSRSRARGAGLAVEGSGVFRRGEAAAGAGEVGQGARDLGADRVDGADVEAMGVVGERPAELTARALLPARASSRVSAWKSFSARPAGSAAAAASCSRTAGWEVR